MRPRPLVKLARALGKEASMAASHNEFVRRLAEALGEDPGSLHETTALADLEGWDSVGQLAVIALVDECFDRRINVDALRKCQRVEDLLKLADGPGKH
jgi:acyl carrier protein